MHINLGHSQSHDCAKLERPGHSCKPSFCMSIYLGSMSRRLLVAIALVLFPLATILLRMAHMQNQIFIDIQ